MHTTAKIAPTQAAFALNVRLPGQFFNFSRDIRTVSPRVQEMHEFFRRVNPMMPRRRARDWFIDRRLINCTHI